MYLGDHNQCPPFRRSLPTSPPSSDKGMNGTPQAQKPDLGPESGPILMQSTQPEKKMNIFSQRPQGVSQRAHRPCDVLSCLEKAVWTFSALTSDEAHYVFQPQPSLPACPSARASQKRLSWEQSLLTRIWAPGRQEDRYKSPQNHPPPTEGQW